MSIRVKVADQPGELKQLFETRHQVYVDEEGYMSDRGGVVVDLYDALPTTVNMVAMHGDEVVGGARLTLDSEAGMPSEAFFDYRSVLPEGAVAASCSMLCVKRAYRGQATLVVGMLMMCAYYAYGRGVTHFCAPVNPLIEKNMARTGFVRVGDERVVHGLPTLPLLLEFGNLHRSFKSFVEQQDLGLWNDSFVREFYAPGEVVLHEGDDGDRVFLVIDGAVDVLAPGEQLGGHVNARLEAGQMFGELALLTDSPRSATVVAVGPTQLMVVDRTTFQDQLRRSPEAALSLLKTIGVRLQSRLAVERRLAGDA